MICLAPRAPGDSVRPRRPGGVVVRPLNFTVRGHALTRTALSVLMGVVLSFGSALANEPPLVDDTPETACSVLKRHMAALMHVSPAAVSTDWWCDVSNVRDNYLYIIQLRSKPREALGTAPLIGTFAVARRSSVVLQYDVANDRLVPISAAYRVSPNNRWRGP